MEIREMVVNALDKMDMAGSTIAVSESFLNANGGQAAVLHNIALIKPEIIRDFIESGLTVDDIEDPDPIVDGVKRKTLSIRLKFETYILLKGYLSRGMRKVVLLSI